MIKVQPARSRLVKTETPDLLTLLNPRRGLLCGGTLLILAGLLWIGVVLALLDQARMFEVKVAGAAGMLPGLVMAVAGLARCLETWSVTRSPESLTFVRKGLLGKKERTWDVQDVSSFWVTSSPSDRDRYHLVVGFRNGRSEDVVAHFSEEDLEWAAAVLKDSRGNRRPPTVRGLAEPVARRVDPSVVPATIIERRLDGGGVELTFLPLVNFKGRWWKLLGWVFVWLGVILAVGTLIGPQVARPITATAVVVLLSVTFVCFMTLNRSAVVFINNGVVTITQNHNQGNYQIPVEDVEFVQTFRNENASELQILLRGKPKLRMLYGRPADELEWAARFLRVALKHRPEETAAPMSVDAAAGVCQVCSEKMETRVVYCGKCRTPHHEECWSYVGQCSTYGCREIRFTRT